MADPALPPTPAPPPAAAPSAPLTRAFGRFALRKLLGRSAGSMVWLAFDPGAGSEVMLTLPRVQPPDPAALARWNDEVQAAARLRHPNLAPIGEVGVQDHWPYIATGREHGLTLGEWLLDQATPAADDAARWICEALQGLAYAHDAGLAHHDLQLHSLLVTDQGKVSVMGLSASGIGDPPAAAAPLGTGAVDTGRSVSSSMALDPLRLRAQRDAATRDVLACGLLLHRLLAGTPALDQDDTTLVAARMTPGGRESVRLPWTTPKPIPEALRVIANRSFASQPRLRYHGARTFLGALEGWRDAHLQDGGGPVALLLDRLQTVGHLPALPGLSARVSRVTSLEGQKTDQIAEQVLEDLALSFELLRTLNSAQVQGTQIQGNGPVLTLRRIISLIGVNGVRLASNTLREWPGPLSDDHAAQLKLTLGRVRLAGHTARALSLPGYDGQVVYLVTVLQNLGRLMLRYHFASEAEQVQLLMKPIPADPATATAAFAGLSEAAASCAVIGVDVEALGTAVALHWGLSEEVLHMSRRLPPELPVRRPDNDEDVLRIVANVANEAVDAVTLQPAATLAAALARVAQRHAHALGIDVRDLNAALQAAREAVRAGASTPSGRPASEQPAGPATTMPQPASAAR